MSTETPLPDDLPLDIGNGLILRRSTTADAERLAEFNKMIHRDPPATEPDEGVGAWTRDLLEKPHPTFRPNDFTIVEERASGRIVSSCCLISQTWSYAGVPFGVGRPELVGTEPEYRARGLVRMQFDLLHKWSAQRNELVQAITGIPYYYRQFGYEMAIDLGGGRINHPSGVPKLKEGQTEPYCLRPATVEDAALFVSCDAQAAKRSLVMCNRDEALWRFEIEGKSENNGNRLALYVLQTAEGRPVGVLGMSVQLWGTRIGVQHCEVLPNVSWLALAPSLLRAVWATGQITATKEGKTLESVQYALGADHPLYRVNHDRLGHARRLYAWYLRVPDIAAFVKRIAPVLEGRLSESVAAGHTGELRLSFYRTGLRVVFESGRIVHVDDWPPDHTWQVGLPGLTFIQLLFGHRTLDELRAAYPDCLADEDEGKSLVEALFPKRPSIFWPLA